MGPVHLNHAGFPEEPTLVLGNKAGKKLGTLIGLDNYVFNCKFSGQDELYFDLYKTIDNEINPYWESVTDFKLVWFKEINTWFQITVELDENNATVKHVVGTPVAEAELSQTNIYDIEINTESDILQDDYVITKFYDSTNAKGSLLDRLLYKNPGYSVGHVDSSLQDIQRTFSWGESTVYNAFQDVAEEIGCLFVFGSDTDTETGLISRTINAYDLMSYCRSCGKRYEGGGTTCPYCGASGAENIVEPYGLDSGIVVSRDNLTQEVRLTTDIDSVKNCFRLTAGDDMMTSAVRYATPDGSGYLWYISDELKAEMSDPLVLRIADYDALYQQYITDWPYTVDSADYNALIQKYTAYSTDYNRIYSGGETPTATSDIVLDNYTNLVEADYAALDFYYYLHDSMMPGYSKPNLPVASQALAVKNGLGSGVSLLNITSHTSSSTVASAIRSMARLYVDSGYDITVSTTSWVPGEKSGTWTGSVTLTNPSFEDDTASTGSFTVGFSSAPGDYMTQVLSKKIYMYRSEAYDIESLFELNLSNFTAELPKYSYKALEEFYMCCQTCLNVLIDNGCGNKDGVSIGGTNWDGYSNVYLPWYNKLLALQNEMDVRAAEVQTVQDMIDEIENLIGDTHQALDFQSFIGSDLWSEFVTFRREDTYTNNNFVSDGLSNAEIVDNARKFIDLANRELYKSAQLQHSIDATLHDLLVIPEFQPIIDNFVIGSWIRVIVDGKPYKLRMIEYEISWSNLAKIDVQFSDVKLVVGGISDIASILDSVQRMAPSYGAVLRKADQGNSANITMRQWIENGLNTTNVRLLSSADNQEWEMDEKGLLMKRWDEMLEEYTQEQMRLTNTTLAYTDDNWETVKTAFGKYYDGDGNAQTGLIGDTIIGKILAGANLVIDSENGSFKVDSDGVYIDSLQFFITHDDGENYTSLETELESLVDEDAMSSAIAEAVEGIEATIDSSAIATYYQGSDDGVPDGKAGDLWYVSGDTDVVVGGNEYKAGYLYRHNGTSWEHLADADAAQAIADAATAQSTADSKIMFFKQSSVPSDPDDGDIWFNTSNSLDGYDQNTMYRYNGSSWEPIIDGRIQANYTDLLGAINDKTDIYSSNTPPGNPSSGDFWYCTQTNGIYKVRNLYRYNGSSWEKVEDDTAQSLAAEAKNTADKKITCSYQSSVPTIEEVTQEGDLWYNTTEQKWYRCTMKSTSSSVSSINDLGWTLVVDGDIQANYNSLLTKINNKTDIYSGNTAPTDPSSGDFWYCTNTSGSYTANNLYQYNGTAWVQVQDSAAQALAQEAQDTADGKVTCYYQAAQPSISDVNQEGDLWYDSDDQKWYRCTKKASSQSVSSASDLDWVSVEDGAISTLSSNYATLANTLSSLSSVVNTKTSVYYVDSVPTGASTGDLWYCTGDTGNYSGGYLYRYNGTTWNHLEDAQATQAIADAATAQATADGKIMFYRQDTAPTIGSHSTGDIWYNTASTDSTSYLAGKLYRCDGSSWTLVEDSSITELESTVASFFDASTGYLDATKLSGAISATNAQMKSSSGNVLFDSDGLWLMDASNKNNATEAVWMNEDGILLGSGAASSDPASNFTWQTAITADGIAAETIAAGTISGITLAGGSLQIGRYTPTSSAESVMAIPSAYATNGSFTGTYYTGAVGRGSDTTTTTTENCHTSSTSATAYIDYSFDLSSIPSMATITGVTCSVKGHAQNLTSAYAKAECQLYTLGTAKGTATSFSATTDDVITVDGGTSWTRDELNGLTLRFTIGRYGGNVTGATITVTYTIDSSGYKCIIDSAGNLGIGPNASAEKGYNFYVDANGNITARSGTFSGAINVNNNFIVDNKGNVTANNGVFTGTIKSSDYRTAGGTSMMNSSGQFTADYLNLKGLSIYNGSTLTFNIDASGNVTMKGSLASGSMIYSPVIYANQFAVKPTESSTSGGSFDIYGTYGTTTEYHFNQIKYSGSNSDYPMITYSSPGGASANWDYSMTNVGGNVNFITGKTVDFSGTVWFGGKVTLNSSQYGSSYPSSPVSGQLFFKTS